MIQIGMFNCHLNSWKKTIKGNLSMLPEERKLTKAPVFNSLTTQTISLHIRKLLDLSYQIQFQNKALVNNQ